MAFRRLLPTDTLSTVLTTQHEFGGNQQAQIHPMQHRKISFLEIMRCQGFPDNFDFGLAS
jgi:site-specific DNA-cytosine methylase